MPPSHLEKWFAQHILPHENDLRRHLKRYSIDPSEIDDIVQGAYTRLLALPPEEHVRIHEPRAYLFRTAQRILTDRKREKPNVRLDPLMNEEAPDLIDGRPSPAEEIDTRQRRALLDEALAALPERCREIMTLRKVRSLSQKEIAARLGITENTVEKQVSKAMQRCAAYISEALHAQRPPAKETSTLPPGMDPRLDELAENDRQASRWLAQLDATPDSQELREDIRRWCARDPDRQAAYEFLEAFWNAADLPQAFAFDGHLPLAPKK